jgi:Zn finger protein HypA/HybF involved in hydrogenase expression
MTSGRDKWISAFKELLENQQAKIKCPECNSGTLQLIIVPWEKDNKSDWHLICNNCKARNVATKQNS